MSYNVSYTSLPTFSSNSIGYSLDASGTFDVSSNNTITVCSFNNLAIGVYIITVNIMNLTSDQDRNYWIGQLKFHSTPTVTLQFMSAPQSIYTGNPYYMSSINFTHIIKQSEITTIDVQVYGVNNAGSITSQPDYNCSIVRIS
jgi:hypothetical protein